MKTLLVLLILSGLGGCSSSAPSVSPSVNTVSLQGDPFNCNGTTCNGLQPGCCGGKCVDLAQDPLNCTTCDNVCNQGTGVNAVCKMNALGTGVCTSLSQRWSSGKCDEKARESYCGCQCQDGTTLTPAGSCSDYSATPSVADADCSSKCQNACITDCGFGTNKTAIIPIGTTCPVGVAPVSHGDALESCHSYQFTDFKQKCFTLNEPSDSVSCTTGYTSCSGRCRYLSSDLNNCGSCGNVCPTDATLCGAGLCASAQCNTDQDCQGQGLYNKCVFNLCVKPVAKGLACEVDTQNRDNCGVNFVCINLTNNVGTCGCIPQPQQPTSECLSNNTCVTPCWTNGTCGRLNLTRGNPLCGDTGPYCGVQSGTQYRCIYDGSNDFDVCSIDPTASVPSGTCTCPGGDSSKCPTETPFCAQANNNAPFLCTATSPSADSCGQNNYGSWPNTSCKCSTTLGAPNGPEACSSGYCDPGSLVCSDPPPTGDCSQYSQKVCGSTKAPNCVWLINLCVPQ